MNNISELSSSQNDIYFDQLLKPNVPVYNIGVRVEINGPIVVNIFKKALENLFNEADVLRAVIIDIDGKPFQKILDKVTTIPFNYIDSFSNKDDILTEMHKTHNELFPLHNSLLSRFFLYKLSETKYFFSLTVHHLIMDGHSTWLFVKRLSEIYNILISGDEYVKECSDYLYFVEEDKKYLQSERYSKTRKYWENQYKEFPLPQYNINKKSEDKKHYKINSKIITLKKESYSNLMHIANEQNLSVFPAIISIFYSTFVILCNREDISFGIPLLNRSSLLAKKTLGHFASVTPFWFEYGTDIALNDLMTNIKDYLMKTYRYQKIPYSEINSITYKNKKHGSDLYEIEIAFNDTPYSFDFNGGKIDVKILENDYSSSLIKITVCYFSDEEDLEIKVEYNNNIVFEISRFENILNYFFSNLNKIYKDKISSISLDDEKRLRFWRTYLEGASCCRLPWKVEVKAENNKNFLHGSSLKLNVELSKSIEKLAAELDVHVKYVLLLVHFWVLNFLGGSNDVVSGYVTNTRLDKQEDERIIRLFLKSLPLRWQYKNENLHQAIKTLFELETRVLGYGQIPLGEIKKVIEIPELFEIIFNYMDSNDYEALEGQDIEIIEDKKEYPQMNCSLFVVCSCLENQISIQFFYDPTKYTEENLQKISGYYQSVLENIFMHSEKIELVNNFLPSAEYKNLLTYYGVKKNYAISGSLVSRFRTMCQRFSKKIALSYEKQSYDYATLDLLSDELAQVLMKEGVRKGDLIGLSVGRGLGVGVGILGILKSGAAYLPIDPQYPSERRNYLINDAKIKYLITDCSHKELYKNYTGKIILLEKVKSEGEKLEYPHLNPNDLAYVIYTSGSTGDPKGVMVEHGHVLRLFESCSEPYAFNEEDVWCLFHSYSFDFSVWELWGGWLSGARVEVVDEKYLIDPALLYDFLITYKITILNQTPSAFYGLCDYVTQLGRGKDCLRYVIFGGEVLNEKRLASWIKNYGYEAPILVNMYGITETTVFVTHRILDGKKQGIGKPLSDMSLYIVDKKGRLVPEGVEGELYIGGAGVARGYLNRPELTAERFIQNPYGVGRLYCSGDIVSRRGDELYFVGRKDKQVKIRGYRIELNEIEKALNDLPGVKDSYVLLRELEDGPQLIGYLILSKEETEIEHYKEALLEKIPSYMVPAHLVQINKLPLTRNGKIDEMKLLALDLQKERDLESPVSKTETILINIWQSILGVTQIGRRDNFFALGGNSILVARMISRLHKENNISISFKSVFNYATIYKLADYIDQNIVGDCDSSLNSIKARYQKTSSLSPAQLGLWIASQYDNIGQNQSSYNIPIAYNIDGKLDKIALQKGLLFLLKRHEILRSSIVDCDYPPQQMVNDYCEVEDNFKIEEVNFSKEKNKIEKIKNFIAERAIKQIKLDSSCLWNTTLIEFDKNQYVLLIILHHIIADGISIAILKKELSKAYNSYVNNVDPDFQFLNTQYSDYATWQAEDMTEKFLEKQRLFWCTELDNFPNLPTEIKTDFERPKILENCGSLARFRFDEITTSKIKDVCNKNVVTPYIFFISIFILLLYKYSNNKQIIIGTDVASRNFSETENMIGFFVNQVVVRNIIDDNVSFGSLLKSVKDKMTNIYDNQDLSFNHLLEIIKPIRSLNRSPLFQIKFAYEDSKDELLLQDLKISDYNINWTIAKHDITFFMCQYAKEFLFSIEYNVNLFKEKTIEQIANDFQELIDNLTEDQEQLLKNITLLSTVKFGNSQTMTRNNLRKQA